MMKLEEVVLWSEFKFVGSVFRDLGVRLSSQFYTGAGTCFQLQTQFG
jgi:hypothetical protein